ILPEVKEALKDLEDTDPTLAKAIELAINKALSGVDAQSNTQEIARVQSLREMEYEEYLAEQRSALLMKYPSAPDTFASPHWKAWKEEQPEHVLNLVKSDSAAAVGMALDLFTKD